MVLAARLILLILAIVVSIYLLCRNLVTSKIRLAFLIAGVLVFGFLFSWFVPERIDPNPVLSLRAVFGNFSQVREAAPALSVEQGGLSGIAMILLFMGISWVSNKSYCGWICQLGLLQDLMYRTRLPKWRPPFWFSNSFRILFVTTIMSVLVIAGLDLIGLVDPFQMFRFNFTLGIGLFASFLLATSLFVYRPWCQFLCPFGLSSWLVEQISILRPRIDREICKRCLLCIKACPTRAMEDIYADKKIHADCFACGACLKACPQKGALSWRTSKRSEYDKRREISK